MSVFDHYDDEHKELQMGEVGGPRHFHASSPPVRWKCPHCRTEQTTRFEDGCPSCGTGTPAMNAAVVADLSAPIDVSKLVLGVIGEKMAPNVREVVVELKAFTEGARQTVAAALAFAAEQGMAVPTEGLSQQAMIAWARIIAGDHHHG